MRRGKRGLVLVLLALASAAGCKRVAPPRLDAVRALRNQVRPAFEPPADGLLKPGDVDLFLRVRGRAKSVSVGEALAAAGADAGEFAWVRARIQEALFALAAERATSASADAYARGIAALREARKAARDPKVTARLDAEIATLERERAGLRRGGPGTAGLSRNVALVARRRVEIEAAGL
jgi:hypothetical protein